MYLNGTTDLIELVTASAGDIEVMASYAEYDDPSTIAANRVSTASITTATTTTILEGAASVIRNPTKISVFNNHASVSNLITIRHTDSSIVTTLWKATLLPGERVSYDGKEWTLFNSSMVPKLISPARESGSCTTAAITSHSADTYYVGIPISDRIKAGSFFRWTWSSTKTAGTAAPTFNFRVGTAGAVADTSRCLVTLGVQTAVADTAYFIAEAGFRAVGASAILQGRVTLRHNLAVTGFNTTVNHMQVVETTGGTFDSTAANLILGLSVNPGASGAWVSNLVCLDAVNLLP